MATWTDSILVYNSGKVQRIAAGDTVAITGGAFSAGDLTATGTVTGVTGNFTGNVAIGGNLVVTGDIISRGAYEVNVGDAFINLLAGNITTGSALPGGWTANIEAQTAAITATAFAASSGGTDGVITVSSSPVGIIDPGDLIQVSASNTGANDGIYVVQGVTATTITVKSNPGATAPAASVPFVKSSMEAGTGESAKVVVAKVSAFAVSGGSIPNAAGGNVSAGVWCYHTGTTEASFTAGWTALTTVTVSLQSAYDGGNTITLTNGNDLIVNKPTSGNAAISLEANSASDITVDGATLTLDASRIDLATGNVNFAKAGTVAATTTGRSNGDIVYFDSSFAAQLSDNDGSAAALNVDGVVAAAGYVATVQGTRVLMAFTSAPSAGDTAWLSSTAGQATATLPTAGRIYRLGRVTGVSSGGLYEVVWNPQYIADL